MEKNNKAYGIECSWDSAYLCKKCGGLLYYDMETKKEYCFNSQCKDYPQGVEIYSTEQADLTLLNNQLSDIERKLGQIVNTCDYNSLVLFLLERRRRIVQKLFTSRVMHIDGFLHSNEILSFIQNYKSLGIRKDPLTFRAILKLYRNYADLLTLLEDLKEGRYLLAKKPVKNRLFVLKYYDVIIDEIWASYGLVNLQALPDVNEFRYHEIIQEIVSTPDKVMSADYAPYFERLWPFAISEQYLFKRNYASSLKYQYPTTTTDLANILSIIVSLKDDNLITVSIVKLLKHFIKQPIKDKNFQDFIGMLSGNNNKIPIMFRMNGNIILDRLTLLLFFIFMYSQHLASDLDVSGQQRISQLKQEASSKYEKLFKNKLENSGYYCLPTSINIGGYDYDVIAYSESNRKILLIETKFKDPSPSSFSSKTLVKQEFTYEKEGLLPQVIKQQKRYDLLIQKGEIFQHELGLQKNIREYSVRPYFITKFTPMICRYGDVNVLSEKKFMEKELSSVS